MTATGTHFHPSFEDCMQFPFLFEIEIMMLGWNEGNGLSIVRPHRLLSTSCYAFTELAPNNKLSKYRWVSLIKISLWFIRMKGMVVVSSGYGIMTVMSSEVE